MAQQGRARCRSGYALNPDAAIPQLRAAGATTAAKTANANDHAHDAHALDRNRFYARKRWAMVRLNKLFHDPLCELEHPGCDGIANEVHHRIALQDGGDEYAIDNLISTCKPCHSHETRREQRERGGEG